MFEDIFEESYSETKSEEEENVVVNDITNVVYKNEINEINEDEKESSYDSSPETSTEVIEDSWRCVPKNNGDYLAIEDEKIMVVKDSDYNYFNYEISNDITLYTKTEAYKLCKKDKYDFDGHKKPQLSCKSTCHVYRKIDDNKYITHVDRCHQLNLKFIIFLTADDMKRKRYLFCGDILEKRLYKKGIKAVSYHNWKDFFESYNGIVPKFDNNEDNPSPHIIYKRFTDTIYFSLDNFSYLSFRAESKVISTLASYLGASKITGKHIRSIEDNTSISVGGGTTNQVSVSTTTSTSDVNSTSIVEVKEFDTTVDNNITLGKTKFNERAKADLLLSIDSEVYERLQLTDIVTQRYNGQVKESYTLARKVSHSDMIYFNTVFATNCPSLNIKFNVDYKKSVNKIEEYEFCIEYHNLQEVKDGYKQSKIEKKEKSKLKRSKSSVELDSESIDSKDIDGNHVLQFVKKKGNKTNNKFLKWVRMQEPEDYEKYCKAFLSNKDIETFLKKKHIL